MALIQAAGFVDVRIAPERYDAFAGAPSESSAAEFGTQGVNICARTPQGPRP